MESTRKAKQPHELTIKRAANGAYIVKHHFDNSGSGESYRQPEEHAFTSHKELMTHVAKHMGGKDDDGYGGGKDTTPKTAAAPPGGKTVAGVSGKAKAAAPSRRTHGAGVD